MNELNFVINNILSDLKRMLDNAGIYYRIFARQKSIESIKKKMDIKASAYKSSGKKMQDIIGVRIVFYFMEDVEIISEYLHGLSSYVNDSNSKEDIEEANKQVTSIKNLDDKIFMPTRLNLIFRMESRDSNELKMELDNASSSVTFDTSLIDDTYEIQLRTVLSEGWHEVEHDLRYKTKNESWWMDCDVESRMLNGIYATLETSERAMDYIFSTIAYKNYRKKEWSAMIRNHLRIHTLDFSIPNYMIDILNDDNELAKNIFRIERKEIINHLLNYGSAYPLKMENIVFLINRMLKTPSNVIITKENAIIKTQLNKIFPERLHIAED